MKRYDDFQAFPCPPVYDELRQQMEEGSGGLTRLEYFASLALSALMKADPLITPEGLARAAFKIADAMDEEAKKRYE